MARKKADTIPIRMAEIYLLGVERLIAVLPDEVKTTMEYEHVASRTRFLRALIDEGKGENDTNNRRAC
jgi:hypothetical protein